MSERNDLIERLAIRAARFEASPGNDLIYGKGEAQTDKEAADTIAAQAATIARLEAEVEAGKHTTTVPLEWVYVNDPCYRCKAKTLFGRYDVWRDDTGYTFSLSGKDCPQVYASEDEAKAAAQEDFASKARSLLVPPRTEGERA